MQTVFAAIYLSSCELYFLLYVCHHANCICCYVCHHANCICCYIPVIMRTVFAAIYLQHANCICCYISSSCELYLLLYIFIMRTVFPAIYLSSCELYLLLYIFIMRTVFASVYLRSRYRLQRICVRLGLITGSVYCDVLIAAQRWSPIALGYKTTKGSQIRSRFTAGVNITSVLDILFRIIVTFK
jgi:hypothetical protein